MKLQISHIGYHEGQPQFEVVRCSDGKRSAPVLLTPPELTQLTEDAGKNFKLELRWYLENYLTLPMGPYPRIAENVQKTMQDWGHVCFKTLFEAVVKKETIK